MLCPHSSCSTSSSLDCGLQRQKVCLSHEPVRPLQFSPHTHHRTCAVYAELGRRVHLSECDLGEMRMQLALQWMQEKLSRTLIETFCPLLALDEPMVRRIKL